MSFFSNTLCRYSNLCHQQFGSQSTTQGRRFSCEKTAIYWSYTRKICLWVNLELLKYYNKKNILHICKSVFVSVQKHDTTIAPNSLLSARSSKELFSGAIYTELKVSIAFYWCFGKNLKSLKKAWYHLKPEWLFAAPNANQAAMSIRCVIL